MAIVNRYKGFSEGNTSTNQKRTHDSDFGENLTRNLVSINSSNSAGITNTYSNSFVNRFGASTHYNTNELQLVNSMVNETININGITVRYMPRSSKWTDEVWNERPESYFDKGTQMNMLLTSVAGFEGEGDVMTHYGIEFREEVVLKLGMHHFDERYKVYEQTAEADYVRSRPLEGDLIVIPFGISSLNRNQYVPKIFEITRVTTYHDGAFFQMGDNYQYKIRARLFELSHEKFGFNPDIKHQDKYENVSDITTKIELVDKVTTDNEGYHDIVADSDALKINKRADNVAIEIRSQFEESYKDGEKLKDVAPVIQDDYTARAFGYRGIIQNLDDI